MSSEESASGINDDGRFRADVDTEHLREFLSALDAIVDECKLDVSESGLRSAVIDPASVAMAEASLDSESFFEYEGRPQTTAVGLYKLIDVIEPAGEAMTLDFDYGHTDKLNITAGPYSYTHACTDPEHIRQEPTLPDMDLAFQATMNVDRIREAVEWFDDISTHVIAGYDVDDGVFYMRADERDSKGNIGTDDGRFELHRTQIEDIEKFGPASSSFSIDYLKDIVQAVPEGRDVQIEIGEEFPLLLSYDIAHDESGTAHGEVQFMQAPRIQSE